MVQPRLADHPQLRQIRRVVQGHGNLHSGCKNASVRSFLVAFSGDIPARLDILPGRQINRPAHNAVLCAQLNLHLPGRILAHHIARRYHHPHSHRQHQQRRRQCPQSAREKAHALHGACLSEPGGHVKPQPRPKAFTR
ncbi:hypothetical protein HNE_1266 [Hyphomonas neptunium ATCC 15444]|uniref:Uncharacterized protein n=1 Tax=Hyphomonas neptunium (strain ATCC 15444) TaxID=228405 RepID=Q0C2Q9_HYPNA|nr:hypothetical protein HNE_1266 [Hyphomonas neptunium ATCC 15444]